MHLLSCLTYLPGDWPSPHYGALETAVLQASRYRLPPERAQTFKMPRSIVCASTLPSRDVQDSRIRNAMSHVNESKTSAAETNKGGAFVRKESGYRNWVKKGSEFAPEGELA